MTPPHHIGLRALLGAGLLVLIACSGSDASAGSGSAVAADQATANRAGAGTMSAKGRRREAKVASKTCGTTNLEQSICKVELILADLRSSYAHVGGGGIGEIRQGAGGVYTVTLPQEERADVLTYRFETSGRDIRIADRSDGTKAY